jgi:hypothetical protein
MAVWLDLGENTYAICGTSIEDPIPNIPAPEGYVKASLEIAVYIWEPLGDDIHKTHLQ